MSFILEDGGHTVKVVKEQPLKGAPREEGKAEEDPGARKCKCKKGDSKLKLKKYTRGF